MPKYTKKQEKLRAMLVERGVDEKKFNVFSKRPYDYCPSDAKKLMEEYKSQANVRRNKEDNTRGKGKS